MTLEQITLMAVLVLLIGRFDACVFWTPQDGPATAVASWVLGGFIILGFVLLWNSVLRAG